MSKFKFYSFFVVCISLFTMLAADVPPAPTPASPPPTSITPQDQEQPLPSSQPAPEEQTSDTSLQVTSNYENAFVKMLLTLVALVVLIFFTVWLFRKLANNRLRVINNRSIKILEKRPLSAKSMLYLVDVAGKQVLISESQIEVRAITTIDEMNPPEES